MSEPSAMDARIDQLDLARDMLYEADETLAKAKEIAEKSTRQQEMAESMLIAAFIFFLTSLAFLVAAVGVIFWGAK